MSKVDHRYKVLLPTILVLSLLSLLSPQTLACVLELTLDIVG